MNRRKMLLMACLTLLLSIAVALPVFADQPDQANVSVLDGSKDNVPAIDKKPESAGLTDVEGKDFGDAKEAGFVGIKITAPIEENKTEPADVEQADANDLPDPLYYFNYAAFQFNDKLYFWAIKPAADGYKYVAPEIVRDGFGNFFNNLRAPVSIINNLLQLNPRRSGLGLARFLSNTVLGVGGFYDASYHLFGIEEQKADFDQTLGYYGVGQGFYLVLPLLGPSSLRGAVGSVGDLAMSPPTYVGLFWLNMWQSSAALAAEKINAASIDRGTYELIVADTLDPYEALKNAYSQNSAERVRRAKNR